MQPSLPLFRLLLVTSTVAGGCTDLSVSVVPVARIDVVPASVSLDPGESMELRATPMDADGNPLPGRGVEWHIGDPSKAIVSSSGVVHALESGVTIVEARSEGAVGKADILVVSPTPKRPDPEEEGDDGDPKGGRGGDTDDDDRSGDGDDDDGDDDDGDDGDGDDDDGDDNDTEEDTGGEGENGKKKGGNGKGDERGGKKK